MNPLIDKLYEYKSISRILRLSKDTCKPYDSTLVHQKLHREDRKSCIFLVEAKRVTPRVKHMDITVYFLQEQFDNSLFVPKDEKYSVIPADMCTKPWSGPIIRRSNKWMTGFRFYLISDT